MKGTFSKLTTVELESIVKSIKFIDKKYLNEIMNEVIRRDDDGIDDWKNEINIVMAECLKNKLL